MKKILGYLRNYKKESILGPLFKLFEAGLELMVPLVVSMIIDNGIDNPAGYDKAYIIKLSMALIGIAFVGFLFAVTAQYFSAKAAVGLSTDVRKSLFDHIQGLSYKEIDEMGTSSLITRMTSDVNQVQVGVNLSLRLLLRSPIIVFGAMIMAFTINVDIALIFVGAIIVLMIIVLGIMMICIPRYQKVQNKLDKVTLSTRENLVGARVVRAFAKEEDEIKHYEKVNNDLTREQKRVGFISGLTNPLTYVVINFAVIILINYGAIKVNNGTMSQGDIVALYNYMSIILVELIKFASLIITINKSIACANRITKVLDTKSTLIHKDGEEEENHHFIEYRNVSLNYNAESESGNSLEDISFTIEEGETIGVIGGTGSGKTSLVNLLPHFYDATQGEVLINGKNVNSYNDVELREMFGIVPQKAVLFNGTIRSNLNWRNENVSDEEILEAVRIAQASDVVNKKEDGLDSVVEQNGSNFSGGQKQRLCIARALVGNPKILILDDSSSALDYQTDAKLRHDIKEISYHPTTILVSQRTNSIQHADKILVLDNGKLVGIGKHDELLKTCEVYQEIYASQNKKEAK